MKLFLWREGVLAASTCLCGFDGGAGAIFVGVDAGDR